MRLEITIYHLAIWRDGARLLLSDLLEVSDIHNLSPPYSDTYSVEAIHDIFGINNAGQIVGKGTIWGETHPLLLEPIK